MHEIYNISNDIFIAYKYNKSKKNIPTIVSLHGLFSSMDSSKSSYMHDFSVKNDLPYICFDALGHGHSCGNFTDQSIDSWFFSAREFIKALCPNGALLIGSSMGGWVSMLLARDMPYLIKGMVCISPAPDFTEDMYNVMSDKAREEIDKGGIVQFSAGPYTYDISHKLINESKKHLLLNSNSINISCPVHILHGINDAEVPYKKSIITIEKIKSDMAYCTIVKGGTHSLSREEDLKLLSDSVVKMIIGL